jgi:uncharacterized protein YyaL (SSP411 family)
VNDEPYHRVADGRRNDGRRSDYWTLSHARRSRPVGAWSGAGNAPEATLRATNRLAGEAGPYLRQQADNLVDWYPWCEAALARLASDYDERSGGFGAAPKFPTPSRLFLLLELACGGDARAAELLAGTLEGMAAGGMWDWVGGGLHRYSVDAMWVVVVGDPSAPPTRALLRAARRSRRAATVVVPTPARRVPPTLAQLVPLFEGREDVPAGTALAYLCEGRCCQLPTDDPVVFAAQMAALAPG